MSFIYEQCDKRQASRGNKQTFHSIANSIPLLNLLETLLFLSAHSTAASATTSTTSAATTWCTTHWFATSASTVTGTSTATSFWTIINEKCVQWNRVWKDVVTDIISTNGQSIQLLWFTTLDSELDIFQMSIHANINTSNGSNDLSTIFKFNGDSLV